MESKKMEGLTTVVRLPSHGVFNPEWSGDIVLDMMGFEEEKMAFGAGTDEALDEVINRCVKSPEGFDASQLTPPDRRFMLMKLRIHTYGDGYHVDVEENNGEVEEKISLDDIEIKELPEDFEMPHGKLPTSGDEVAVRLLTVAERRKIDDYATDKARKLGRPFSEIRYETLSAKGIASVNGKEMTTSEADRYLHQLKGKDLAYIRYLQDKFDFGFGTTVTHKCKDGVTREIYVRMTGEFFRPRFDD